MGRPAEARIDLDALRHNHAQLRRCHGGRLLAVLKADAYGHGAVRCARALSQGLVTADAFAVAFADEAFALRAAGIDTPILVLEGAFDADELRAMHAAGLWTVVHHAPQLAMLEAALPRGAAMNVWLKVDSGMHRAGFAPNEAAAVWRRLREMPAVGDITLMSHFARADEPDCGATVEQIACFDAATAGLPGARSLANSAGILAWPSARRDWGRAGIALYGASPLPNDDRGLRPVMTLQSRVFAVRDVAVGEPVGYGARWSAARPSRIGLVALGYADGYPRQIAQSTPVAVDGQLSRIVGRVSMDMLTVDLTHLPHSTIGSAVELWGAQVPVNAVAQAAGTIAYTLLCGVKRVPVVDA